VDAFLQITPDGEALIWISRSEMGQGVRTALPMIVADELEMPWERVHIRQADAAADGRFGSQLTGGSLSVRTLYEPLRRSGAVAREMLRTAAAGDWGVPLQECVARDGAVTHEPTGRRLAYRDLLQTAATVPVPDPETVSLKSPDEFRIIGTSIPRVDGPDMVTGTAVFGLDKRVPDMLYAAVARCPVYGGTVGRVDSAAAERLPGVVRVVETEGRTEGMYMAPGVAVIATDSWAALRGVQVLDIEWDAGPNRDENSEGLRRRLLARSEQGGTVVMNTGDAAGALDRSARRIRATYELPFLAHAPMEPMNCVAHVRADSCEIWSPTQNPQAVQRLVAQSLGVAEGAVTIHVTLVGGGFGRRLYPDAELEAVMIARQVGAPVKVLWTREDDVRHDRYRPASLHTLEGGLDEDRRPIAWSWHILNTHTERFVPEDFPARAIPNYHVEYSHVPWILPRGAWRATTNSQNPFVVESFLDELAVEGGHDPVQLRLDLLGSVEPGAAGGSHYDRDRLLHVLEVAAEMGAWGSPLPGNQGRGVAFFSGYDSYVAMVAHVESSGEDFRVHEITCAIDCGQVINPDMVTAQVEGAVAFALSAGMHQRITVEGGRVQQSNFHDFPVLAMREMPAIHTHIISSRLPPGGVGETPLPPTAPAVTNALFAASGRRIRSLPIS
jgi:CO/xanthine dehydrogenase Mo-binding subunit